MRGTQSRLQTAIIAILSAVALAGVPLVGAAAAPADETLASANPENWTPHVIDNSVFAVVQVGGKVLVGGDFTQLQEAGANSPDTVANFPIINRPYLFAFDAQTGEIDNSFAPALDGEVRSIVPSPSGNSVWIAGAFSSVDGNNFSRLALLDVGTGEPDPTFDAPNINAEVNDVNVSNGHLYIGGDFQMVGGQPRTAMASLNATTGALTDHFAPVMTGQLNGGLTSVRNFDVTPDGDRLVAVGNFTAVDGQKRVQIAMWNTAAAVASLRSWRTARFGNFCSSSFDSYMRDIDMSPDGSFFLVVTTGAYHSGRLCDSASRWETSATGSVTNPSWIDYTGGDTLTAVEVSGPVAYVGGHPRWLNNPFARDSAGSGAVPREGIAAIDTRNGLPMSWNPTRARGIGVWDFDTSGTHLWAGSDTNIWANEYRPRLAAFPFASGTQIPSDNIGDLPGEVLLLGKTSGTKPNKQRLVQFDGTSATSLLSQTGVESWSHARGAFMVDNQVFTGWDDGTFKVRSFGDAGWGAPQNIDLYQGASDTPGFLSNFINDVSRVSGIFYEPVQSRIYYTMNGSDDLYWRYFTPESRIVGAQRFIMTGAASASLDPRNVRGMFLVDNQLYFGRKDSGALASIGFVTGTLGPSATIVNTEIDWRAAGMALSSQPSTTGPNTPPSANFTTDCAGLTCTVDATNSFDPDGSIDNYAWNFGDGVSSGGKTAQRRYQAAGDYTITLTVTDNRGATDQVTMDVSVAPIPSSIGFRAAASRGGGQATNPSVDIPDTVQAGDAMVLLVSNSSSRTVDAPGDWTLLDTHSDTNLKTDVFWRFATASDAGQTVQVTLKDQFGVPTSAPSTVTLSAYSGVGSPPVTGYASADETTPSPLYAVSHTTPSIDVPVDGSWVVSYWADRTSLSTMEGTTTTTDWTEPAGQTVRAEAYNSATGGRVTSLLTDDGTPSPAGARSGLTATADGQTRQATMWTIVLGPD